MKNSFHRKPTSKTQSINGGTTYHGGGNGFATGVIPVTGMYFVHSDHLGSVTMLTDGSGSPVTGQEGGGKSYISYKPYGEIISALGKPGSGTYACCVAFAAALSNATPTEKTFILNQYIQYECLRASRGK